jgi:hypothetical protein
MTNETEDGEHHHQRQPNRNCDLFFHGAILSKNKR